MRQGSLLPNLPNTCPETVTHVISSLRNFCTAQRPNAIRAIANYEEQFKAAGVAFHTQDLTASCLLLILSIGMINGLPFRACALLNASVMIGELSVRIVVPIDMKNLSPG